MIAADRPIQRPEDARLLILDNRGRIQHTLRSTLPDHFRAGDLVIANDAATLPASLQGTHRRSGEPVEIRLAARRSLASDDVHDFTAIVFGRGDYRSRTEERPSPPVLSPGDEIEFGSLKATILRLLDHPRLIEIHFHSTPNEIWRGLARCARPIQYSHVPRTLELWDTWTRIAATPVAFEPPSAGFALDWNFIAQLQAHGIGFATITHAAGISSTGDALLDRQLPFDEPYRISTATARAITAAKRSRSRIIAIGTTVVRALEHAAQFDGTIEAVEDVATQRIDANSQLRIVDAILSGTHERGTSHYELLRAFTSDTTLRRADRELNERGYRTHEFGDSVLVERSKIARSAMPTHFTSAVARKRATEAVAISK